MFLCVVPCVEEICSTLYLVHVLITCFQCGIWIARLCGSMCLTASQAYLTASLFQWHTSLLVAYVPYRRLFQWHRVISVTQLTAGFSQWHTSTSLLWWHTSQQGYLSDTPHYKWYLFAGTTSIPHSRVIFEPYITARLFSGIPHSMVISVISHISGIPHTKVISRSKVISVAYLTARLFH